jgi:hypothetical protein
MNIQVLAATFYDAICDAVTSEELAQIKGGANVHDILDANHYLVAAYEELLGRECDLTDEDIQLMDEASEYAHNHFFK